jgi:serine/threonine-protein kinase
MNPERWRLVESLVEGALAVPAGEPRAAWLAANCGGDERLRAEAASLVAVDEEAADFLGEPVAARAARLLAADDCLSRAGQRVGQYELIEEIGRGGMGVVYLAERGDGEFRQRVAVKLIRRGLDTEDILRRFLNERQILSGLGHPNIARLLDGGTTPDGAPYFVMEYVEGLPLLRFCDERGLSVAERLRMFRLICSAVQYAHQNLVVHRDLKPSNVLVTDGGEPKLLDFGVAKLLKPQASPGAGMTETRGVRVMTPEYASPEQVRGERVTTATDVYSLGVILYELLTGARPYRLKGASPEELSKAVCDYEPSKPSEAIPGPAPRAPKSKGGPSNPNPPPRNPKLLRGDLDNIVLMAMRKEAARRYQSVEQFSADIERHLKGQPVIARNDTIGYRASKFVRRHRAGVAATALVALAVVAGLVGTAWQARAARVERDRANAEKLKAKATSDFLKRMLAYSNPVSKRAGGPGVVTVEEMLDEASRRLEGGEFAGQPDVRAELESIIGESYTYFGKYDAARRHFKTYIELQAGLYGPDGPQALLADHYRAIIHNWDGEPAQAEEILRRILPRLREEQRAGRIGPETLAEALNNLAYVRRQQGDPAEAEALFREALELAPRLPPERLYLARLAHSALASSVADQGRDEEALRISAEAVDEYRRSGTTGTPDYGFALTVYGGFLTEEGHLAEAGDALRQAETILREGLSPTHLWLGDNLRNQAVLLYRQSEYDAALSRAADALKIYGGYGKLYDHYPTVLALQGLILSKTGRAAEGERLIREAVQIRTQTLKPGHYFTSLAKGALGECLTIQRRFDEAEPLLVESYTELRNSQGPQNPRTRAALERLVTLYENWGKADRAAEYRSRL